MKNMLVVALLLSVLSGCTVGPKYKKPEFHPPATFYTQEQATNISAADLAWWELFKDPVLQNPDPRILHEQLRLAVGRIARRTGTRLARRYQIAVLPASWLRWEHFGTAVSGGCESHLLFLRLHHLLGDRPIRADP